MYNNNAHYQYLSSLVKKAESAWVAPTAVVLGNVHLAAHSSVWYGAVLRADFDHIYIGERTNVQDGVIMHVDEGKPLHAGNDVVIGHAAILHGCTVGDSCLIGMRATVMNDAKIGRACVIGAHALVTEGMEIPDFSMVLGSPGKVVKTLPEAVIQLLLKGVKVYMDEAARYLAADIV